MIPKCKCGGDLKREDMPGDPEHEAHVIGRCIACKKPYQFSKPMWENFVENSS